MKRIIAVFLALSLLIVSASAAGIYEVEDDTSVLMMSPVSVMSSDSGISTAEFDGDDSNYLRLIYENILNLTTHVTNRFDLELSDMDNTMLLIYQRLANTNTAIGTVNSWLSTINTSLGTINSSVGTSNYWLQQIWGSISDFATENTLLSVLSEVSSLDTILAQISNKVATETTLSDISDKVATESTLLDVSDKVATENTLNLLLLGSRVYKDQPYLNTGGFADVAGGTDSLNAIIRYGFLGLGSLSRISKGQAYLHNLGVETVAAGTDSFTTVIRAGFLGLRALLSGSESDNNYDGSITSNENTETSFTATGLGPMLNKYMDAIQYDTGLLSYMFASPDDLELKAESLELSSSVSDSFYSSDAEGASVNLDTVSSLKQVSDGAADLFDTGYGVADLFTEIDSNADFLSWFTAETAQALDSSSQVMSVADEDPYNMYIYYDQLNSIALKRGEDADG